MKKVLLTIGLTSMFVLAGCSENEKETKKENEIKVEDVNVNETKKEEVVKDKVVNIETKEEIVEEVQEPVVFDFTEFETRLAEKDVYLANAKAEGIDAAGTQTEMNNYAAKDSELSEQILTDLVNYIIDGLGNETEQEAFVGSLDGWLAELDEQATAAANEYKGGSIEPLVYYATMTEGYENKINELITQYK